MEKLNNNIIEEIDGLFNNFKSKKEYNDYILIIEKLRSNKEIISLIEKIKKLQKKYIRTNNINYLQEIDKYKDKLNKIPLYINYLEYRSKIQIELKIISDTFDIYFEKTLSIK